MDLEAALQYAIDTLQESQKDWLEAYRINAEVDLFDHADNAMDEVENCDCAADALMEFLRGLKAATALEGPPP